MPLNDLTLDSDTSQLLRLAKKSLELWDIPVGSTIKLINISENATFLVEGPATFKATLRIHRNGYHSRRAVECELDWVNALSSAETIPPHLPIPGRDGHAVQVLKGSEQAEPHMMVLFEYIHGIPPSQNSNLEASFLALGKMAAQCHKHAYSWEKPEPFERLKWDAHAIFGPSATWGDWRDAPHVNQEISAVLERVQEKITARLDGYGKSPHRFNLIHADMRLANLLITPEAIHLIDFDDCGFGWFMYDFAAAISFMEDDPRVPALKAAWLHGYQMHRALEVSDLAEIETMIMLRRMALLAWIGSHMHAPEPQALAPTFAKVTAELGQIYLDHP